MDELLKEYVDLYGKNKWALSTYSSNTALIRNYISPKIGSMKLSDINTQVIERYYQSLLKTKAVPKIGQKTSDRFLTPHTVRDIHKILRSCFNQAVKWEIMVKNPASNAMVPKAELQIVKRTVLKALEDKDVVRQFPATSSQTSTVLVLR